MPSEPLVARGGHIDPSMFRRLANVLGRLGPLTPNARCQRASVYAPECTKQVAVSYFGRLHLNAQEDWPGRAGRDPLCHETHATKLPSACLTAALSATDGLLEVYSGFTCAFRSWVMSMHLPW